MKSKAYALMMAYAMMGMFGPNYGGFGETMKLTPEEIEAMKELSSEYDSREVVV